MSDKHGLKTPQSMEYKVYAAFASQLMTGIDIGGRYLQMHVNNRPTSSEDAAKFKIDAILTVDGSEIGKLDVERKPKWNGGDWCYRRINIPVHPYTWFDKGEQSSVRFNSKILGLFDCYKSGRPGLWVGYSSRLADSSGQRMMVNRQSCMVVPAEHIFGPRFNPVRTTQHTRYGTPVEVIALPNEAGILCTCEEDFTDVVVDAVKKYLQTQEVSS